MADDPERDIYPSKEIKNSSVASEIHGKSIYFISLKFLGINLCKCNNHFKYYYYFFFTRGVFF